MTEKHSSSNTPLIIAAIIGALGGIFAACIGLVPTILPMVRPTFTPTFFVPAPTDTVFVPPTETLIPDTPTITPTFTDVPTLTPTLEPLPTETPVTQTATVTVTALPPEGNLEAYVGTWVNTNPDSTSDKVRLVPDRVEVIQAEDGTASLSLCRIGQNRLVYVLPHPAPATMHTAGITAQDFTITRYKDLRWAVLVQRTGDEMIATVQEYDVNNVLLASDVFHLQKPSLIGSIILPPCEEPGASQ